MKPVIEFENITKEYRICHEQKATYNTLVETLTDKAQRFYKRLAGHPVPEKTYEIFRALEDVSSTIYPGDRVGLIGRNGAGKSTLLKILSRITYPTQGALRIRGKLSSLLEVGTGFHPELTGRENIYLNGAILGMPKRHIDKKFDEIVAFAEVEKFLDTPVKRFSSGMFARLGFAIAAHLDPDILIADEVLAVGDSNFQKKCLGKLGEMGEEGRTVLFVSHDIGSVLSLCNKGIYLEKGRIVASGDIDTCVNAYMRESTLQAFQWSGDLGDEHIRVYAARVLNTHEYILQGEKTPIEIEYEVLNPHQNLDLCVSVWNRRHQFLARSRASEEVEHYQKLLSPGRKKTCFELDSNLFHEGEYTLHIEALIHHVKWIIANQIVLNYPVFDPKKQTRFSHNDHSLEGLTLGKQWQVVT